MKDWPVLVFLAGLYFIIPAALGRWVGGSWANIALAFGVWTVILLLFGMSSGSTWGEKLGWPLIFGMFFSIPVIPLITWIIGKFR